MQIPAKPERRCVSIIALSALLLSACSVTRPVQVAPTTARMDTVAMRSLSLPVGQPGSPSDSFRSHIADALKQAGISLDTQARLIADVSLSVAPAEMGVVSKPAQNAAAGREAQWLAAPRDKCLLDRCRAQRMKGVLSVFDRETGNLVFRSESTAMACSFSAEDQRAAADALIADLTASRAI